MASGKKNYFRYSFFASEDAKIQQVIEEMGEALERIGMKWGDQWL
jgi:aspartate/methionine/tyrosine aminotransferase